MAHKPHIEVITDLFIIDQLPATDEAKQATKLAYLNAIYNNMFSAPFLKTIESNVTENPLRYRYLDHSHYMIRELLKRGYSSAQLQKWFNCKKANISYHKNNPSTKEYFCPVLEGREVMSEQVKHTRFRPNNYIITIGSGSEY